VTDHVQGFAAELGIRVEETGDGTACLRFTAEPRHLNPGGTVHGGVLTTLLDTAMASAARTSTEDGEVPATSQLTVAFLSAGREGELWVSAHVRKQGDHLLFAEADVEQDGRTVAHALATFAVLHR
jgi:uncharacterized protein (TIGR00369 family)